MPESENRHLVPLGWQNNFMMDDKRLAILDARTGQRIDDRTSPKYNFSQDQFNSFIAPPGVFATDLEDEWARIESSSSERIRTLSSDNVNDDEMRAAVLDVFALHIVRSHTYLEAHRRVAEQVRQEHAPVVVEADETRRAIVMYDEIVTKFGGLYVELVESPTRLPGFILSDVPVVHADLRSNRYGLRDGLAIDDANVIIGPLTRYTAACLTAKPKTVRKVKTKNELHLINALFWRAAREVVACHPKDVQEAQRAFEHLDELPVEKLAN